MMYYTYLRFLLVALAIGIFSQNYAQTQGFFLDGQPPKKAIIPDYEETAKTKKSPDMVVKINENDTIAKVSNLIYGNNSNIYMEQMVTEDTLIQYIKWLSPNVIRYPGGNLSNLFFFNVALGELPDDAPVPLYGGVEERYEENYWYGNNTSDTTLSVANYYKMLNMVDAEGIICVNYSYARYGLSDDPVAQAAHLAAEWVRYDNGQTRFWEIGNENFGHWQAGYNIEKQNNKDGQPKIITGEVYGRHFNVFADSMRKAAKEIGTEIKIGAAMVEVEKPYGTKVEQQWNDGVLKNAGKSIDFLIVHTYYTPWQLDADIPVILNSGTQETRKMMAHMVEMCEKHQLDPLPVAFTEWNIFAINRKQSCSYISGMHAAIALGEIAACKYGLSCRWDLANAYDNGDDHGMFNRGDEPGVPKWNPRPAYFYMYYFQRFFGDYMTSTKVENNEHIICYSSKFSSGETGIVLINKNDKREVVELTGIKNIKGKRYYYYTLSGGEDNGDFSQQVFINNIPPNYRTGGPIKELIDIKAWSNIANGSFMIEIPAYSVVYLMVDK